MPADIVPFEASPSCLVDWDDKHWFILSGGKLFLFDAIPKAESIHLGMSAAPLGRANGDQNW
jgi:hypothetical protein